MKRQRGQPRGPYFAHPYLEGGVRRLRWHYISKGRQSTKRRESLVRLLARDGWRGTGYFAGLLGVSESTIRRDFDVLAAEGRVVRKKYGGYLADLSGTLLKDKPWIAWS
ncbi:MAG: DeoR family transcriptional regulator [Nitrososphaerota archaeon]|nr:DeoR family transcriptional regulator [Nitrososphaerota archaeon]